MEKYVITISRRFASKGHEIAGEMGRLLGIPVYDRSVVETMALDLRPDNVKTETMAEAEGEASAKHGSEQGIGLLRGLFRRDARDEAQDEELQEYERQSQVIRSLAEEGSCIIIGRCADRILKDHPRALHIFIYAAEEERIRNTIEMLHTGRQEARALLINEDRSRENYRKRFVEHGDDEVAGRHILIDSGRFGAKQCARILTDAALFLFGDDTPAAEEEGRESFMSDPGSDKLRELHE